MVMYLHTHLVHIMIHLSSIIHLKRLVSNGQPFLLPKYSKTIRSEYLGTLQLSDILTFMWIASKIDILLYSQTYEKKHF